jgi:hypothetical protein
MKKTMIKNNKRSVNKLAWKTIKATLDKINMEQNEDLAWDFFNKLVLTEFFMELGFNMIGTCVYEREDIVVSLDEDGYVANLTISRNGIEKKIQFTKSLITEGEDQVLEITQEKEYLKTLNLTSFIEEVINSLREIWLCTGFLQLYLTTNKKGKLCLIHS